MKPNAKQQQAIEYLEGPLLVLAGPGTGKTQLLSTRVAHILQTTDTAPESILCLTYTENATLNMRNRLASIVGVAAHQVNIHTYHAFGATILQQYQQYNSEFDRPLDEAIDEVTQFKIINQIVKKLPADDILRPHAEQITKLKDIVDTIGDAKNACLTPDDLVKIAKFNSVETAKINETLAPLLARATPRINAQKGIDLAYQPALEALLQFVSPQPILRHIEREANVIARELKDALDEATAGKKPKLTPLSTWRRKYFEIGPDGNYRLTNVVAAKKLISLAGIMEKYQSYLAKNGLYDYSDMIQMAIQFLHDDRSFRLTMSERYQSILLDEFQDTNPAQFELIKLLTDYEKPQVMAVGDDDQAICEFQGANASNLLDFQNYYNAKIITLEENYRSTQDILDLSRHIADQLEDSFAKKQSINKQLIAKSFVGSPQLRRGSARDTRDGGLSRRGPTKPLQLIARHEFISSDAEYAWIADQIVNLVDQGITQSEIAVIAPKHKLLLPLLPYLDQHTEINVSYEKNDDILADQRIGQLLKLAHFVSDLAHEKNPAHSWLEILSFPFWQIPPTVALDTIQHDKHKNLDYLLKSEHQEVQNLAQLIAELVQLSFDTPLELLLDYMIGVIDLPSGLRSPFLNYYTQNDQAFSTFELYNHLSVLLTKIKNHTKTNEKGAVLEDLITYHNDCLAGEFQLFSTSPYHLDDNSVSLLSVHKAKGLEFKYVFMLEVDNQNWGKSKGNNDRFVLPKNLIQIRHTGQTADEKLRLLFVAMTRAKTHLIMTGAKSDFSGKPHEHLEYLAETEDKSPYLPTENQKIIQHQPNPDLPALAENLQTHWLAAYHQHDPDLREILKHRMENYKITATDLTTFVDIIYSGPMAFYERKVLRAPSEPKNLHLALGDAVHAAFEHITRHHADEKTALQLLTEHLEHEPLSKHDFELALQQGQAAIRATLAQFGDLLRSDQAVSELDFYSEHLQINDIQLTGKIDHLQIDKANKTIKIYDFKTGNHHKPGPKAKWKADATLYKYALQLEFYKLLLKTSPLYRNYNITEGHILFVVPEEKDHKIDDEVYQFTDKSAAEFFKLLQSVYRHAVTLDFLDNPKLALYSDKTRDKKALFDFVEQLKAE